MIMHVIQCMSINICTGTVLGVSNVAWWLMIYADWERCNAEFQLKMDHLDTETESEYKSSQFHALILMLEHSN